MCLDKSHYYSSVRCFHKQTTAMLTAKCPSLTGGGSKDGICYFLQGRMKNGSWDNRDGTALCLKKKCCSTSARLNATEVFFNTENDQHVDHKCTSITLHHQPSIFHKLNSSVNHETDNVANFRKNTTLHSDVLNIITKLQPSEADSCLANQKHFHILWNQKSLCRFRKTPPLDLYWSSWIQFKPHT